MDELDEKIEEVIEKKVEEKLESSTQDSLEDDLLDRKIEEKITEKIDEDGIIQNPEQLEKFKEKDVSRRSFLKLLGVGAGGLALSSSAAAGWNLLGSSSGVSQSDLTFDPATQTELDNHAGTSNAHHTRYTDAEAVNAVGISTSQIQYGSSQNTAVTHKSGSEHPVTVTISPPTYPTNPYVTIDWNFNRTLNYYNTNFGCDYTVSAYFMDGSSEDIATGSISNEGSDSGTYTFNSGPKLVDRFEVYITAQTSGTSYYDYSLTVSNPVIVSMTG